MSSLRLATRASRLALVQSRWVASTLSSLVSGLEVSLVEVSTEGDVVLDKPLHLAGGKGLFTKEVDQALLDLHADLAVHSLKDLPTVLTPGLVLAAVPVRAATDDLMITPEQGAGRLDEMAQGAIVGCGSLRRSAQLLRIRPDLVVKGLRGNVETRLRKLHEEGLAGIILARAGLDRLDITTHSFSLFEHLLPAAGQGALGIVARADDKDTLSLLQNLDDSGTRSAVSAERAFLNRLEAGCHAPAGIRSDLGDDGSLSLEGAVFSLDGRDEVRSTISGPADEAESLGIGLADKLLADGAGVILEAAKASN